MEQDLSEFSTEARWITDIDGCYSLPLHGAEATGRKHTAMYGNLGHTNAVYRRSISTNAMGRIQPFLANCAAALHRDQTGVSAEIVFIFAASSVCEILYRGRADRLTPEGTANYALRAAAIGGDFPRLSL